MRVHQLLTFSIITILPFFPVQIDARIPYIIGAFAILLTPVFIKNLKKDLAKKNPITIFFTLFLLASLLSTIFSIDQKRSIVQLMLYVSYFVIFTSIRSIFPTLRSKELFAAFFLLITFLLSLISLYNTLIIKYVNRATEGVSFMWIYYGHNHLATLLLFAIPISLYFLKTRWNHKKYRLLLLVACCLLLVSFFFTLARSAMLSLFLATVLCLLIVPVAQQRARAIVLIGIVFTLFIFLFGFFASNRYFAANRPRVQFDNLSGRAIYWQQAVNNFKKHPLTGTGLDTFRIVNKREPMPKRTIGSYYAHNFFLQMLTDAGIFGFVTSLGLIGSVLWQGFKKLHTSYFILHTSLYVALFVGILASTLMAMLDMGWQLPTVFLIFWIFAGLFARRSR